MICFIRDWFSWVNFLMDLFSLTAKIFRNTPRIGYPRGIFLPKAI